MEAAMDAELQAILKRCEDALSAQANGLEKYRRYHDGDQRLSFATSKYREEFTDMLREVMDNWCPMVVDAVSERMHVEGFRFGVDGTADADAWDIWQRCSLDSDSELLHTESLITGIGYAMVWADADGVPLVTVEDPTQMVVLLEAGSRRKRRLAFKRWCDDWSDATFSNLYLPDSIIKFRTHKGVTEETGRLANPLGEVPVVPFYNRPRTMPGSYRSELHDVLSTQDQINKILCDAIVASEFAAYRQRWATGVEVELDEVTKKPINPWESGQNRVMIATDPDSRFGTFESTDLGNYTKMLENRIQSIASRTRTPPHYLLGQSGSFPSGESLKATETGLIAKVRSRHRHFGESWEEVMRLAFGVSGDSRSEYWRAETIWADPESRTEAEHVDALTKLRSLGVPIRQLWEDAGYSQEQITRMIAFADSEAMRSALANPPSAIVVPQAESL